MRSCWTRPCSRRRASNGRIAADGQIAGGFTQEEAQNLALILRSGALPATLTYLQEQTIGPTLGADSIRAGVLASLAGLVLIVVFLLFYYKLSGVNAIVALVLNLIILLGMMAYVGAVMTLPGIAGFILTIGIGVDSNVLIFERIKEELEAGKGRQSGHQRRLQPRLPHARRHARGGLHRRGVPVPVRHRPDSRVRGHADLRADLEPLHLDIHFQVALRAGPFGPPAGADAFHLAMHIFKNANFDFLRWRWQAMALSVLVIAAGLFVILTRGIPLGVEFSGGTNLIVRFSGPVSEDQIRGALQAVPHEVQSYGEPGANQLLIRLPQTAQTEQGASLSADVPKVEQMLKASGLPAFTIEGTEIVGPTVGAALRRQAIYATLLSMLGITTWIAIRFRVSFALGSIIATFHDVFVTLSFLAFFQYEMSLNVIAAMLTMVGYSMNDMIVIFDRVRENTRLSRREPLESAINTSLNQTLTRTLITSGTVFMAVLALVSLRRGSAQGIRLHDARRHDRDHLLGLVHRPVARDHAQQEAVWRTDPLG